jgi:hypothetical protein
LPWYLRWYASRVGYWGSAVPSVPQDLGQLVKAEVVPTFDFSRSIGLFSWPGGYVIMVGEGVFPDAPTETVSLTYKDGVRLYSGPFKVYDDWTWRPNPTSGTVRASGLQSPPAGIWRIEYFANLFAYAYMGGWASPVGTLEVRRTPSVG